MVVNSIIEDIRGRHTFNGECGREFAFYLMISPTDKTIYDTVIICYFKEHNGDPLESLSKTPGDLPECTKCLTGACSVLHENNLKRT